MEKCYSPNLFSPINTSKLLAVQRLYAFRDLYLCLPICGFGVITNVIHILVLTSKTMRNSAVNVILTAIAICDAGTMLSYLIYLIHFVLSPKDYCSDEGSFLAWGWMFFLMIHISVSIALHTSSLWLAVTMAFIRLMTLRQGSLSSSWQKSKMAWRMSFGIYSVVFVLCTPTIVSHQIKEFNRSIWHGMCGTNRSRSEYMNDTSYGVFTIGISSVALADDCSLYKANLWLTGVMFKVIPCLLLIFLSSSLLVRISEAEKNRQRLLGSGKKVSGKSLAYHNRKRRAVDHTTIMLISILLVFLMTEFPQGVIAIMNAVYLRDVTAYVYQSLDDFMDLLSLVNASVNFILYCVMSTRYRQTFWKVVLPRKMYVRFFIRGRRSSPGMTGQSEAATATYFPTSVNHPGGRYTIEGSPYYDVVGRDGCSSSTFHNQQSNDASTLITSLIDNPHHQNNNNRRHQPVTHTQSSYEQSQAAILRNNHALNGLNSAAGVGSGGGRNLRGRNCRSARLRQRPVPPPGQTTVKSVRVPPPFSSRKYKSCSSTNGRATLTKQVSLDATAAARQHHPNHSSTILTEPSDSGYTLSPTLDHSDSVVTPTTANEDSGDLHRRPPTNNSRNNTKNNKVSSSKTLFNFSTQTCPGSSSLKRTTRFVSKLSLNSSTNRAKRLWNVSKQSFFGGTPDDDAVLAPDSDGAVFRHVPPGNSSTGDENLARNHSIKLSKPNLSQISTSNKRSCDNADETNDDFPNSSSRLLPSDEMVSHNS